MERKLSLEERPSRSEMLARRSMSICSANIISHMTIQQPSPEETKQGIPHAQSENKISKDLQEIQKKKFGTRSKTVMDCRSYLEKKNEHSRFTKRSSSVKERRIGSPDSRPPSKSPSEQSMGSKTWDTTEKVLGVHTVLGTAGLTSSTLITIPSLGGGVVGGCAAAAMGVATAASFVTGVGVLAGLGVAGVQYAKAKHKESIQEEEEKRKQEEEEEDKRRQRTSLSSFSDIESEEEDSEPSSPHKNSE